MLLGERVVRHEIARGARSGEPGTSPFTLWSHTAHALEMVRSRCSPHRCSVVMSVSSEAPTFVAMVSSLVAGDCPKCRGAVVLGSNVTCLRCYAEFHDDHDPLRAARGVIVGLVVGGLFDVLFFVILSLRLT